MTMGIALEDGLLQQLWFFQILLRMMAPPGRARWTRPRLPKLPRTQEVESWQENFRTIISSGVCAAKSTDIHNGIAMNITIRKFYTVQLFYCLNINTLLCYVYLFFFLQSFFN